MTDPKALLTDALALDMAMEWDAASKAYDSLVTQFPTFAPGLWAYAQMLHSFPKIPAAMDKATKLYRQTTLTADLEYDDLRADSWNNLGIIMLTKGHADLAIGCFQHTLSIIPDHQQAVINLGAAYRIGGDMVGAENAQGMVLAKHPDAPAAHHERAFIRLTRGDLKGGFEEYEWRWKDPAFISARMDDVGIPRWGGEDLTGGNGENRGKSILLPYEQGFGDAIMFIRYARLIKWRWPTATVSAWVPPELVRLIGWADGVDHVYNSHEPIPDTFDFYCPMISLAHVFGTTLETVPSEPYIRIPDGGRMVSDEMSGQGFFQRNAGLLAPHETRLPSGALRVGIVWAGRTEHSGDKWRSTKLADWKDVLSVEGVQFYSLQAWRAREQLVDAPNVIDGLVGADDFTDTARTIAGLDLVISVDTAVVHLAGAMGKAVWTLVPWSPDWRWMLSGETTPWYPTMRLFRQEKRGDWSPVFARVKAELETRVKSC